MAVRRIPVAEVPTSSPAADRPSRKAGASGPGATGDDRAAASWDHALTAAGLGAAPAFEAAYADREPPPDHETRTSHSAATGWDAAFARAAESDGRQSVDQEEDDAPDDAPARSRKKRDDDADEDDLPKSEGASVDRHGWGGALARARR